jgi:uncharacterized protein
MDINVRPLLSGEKREITFDYTVPLDYSENGYAIHGDAVIRGSVRDMGGYMQLDARCSAEYDTVCARCLKPLREECFVDFTRPVAARLESEDEDEEYLLIGEGGVINVDEAITEELLLSLPFRSLCKDDCLGLCPKCGCNKNEKDCGCVLKEPDPRFAILKTVKFRDE